MTATKTMEELYTLQVQIETDQMEAQPESHSVDVDADREDIWLDRLGFSPGVAGVKKAAELSQDNKLDVLACIGIDDEEHEVGATKGLAIPQIIEVDYEPSNPAGSRITVVFSTYHFGSCLGNALLLVTIGLSHSINR